MISEASTMASLLMIMAPITDCSASWLWGMTLFINASSILKKLPSPKLL